jgi:hypothetical protein
MAFEILAKLGLNATGFASGLKRAESQSSAWAKRIRGSVSSQLTAAFGGAAIAAGIKRSLDRAGEIADQSAAIGVTAERFQELAFAAKMSGTDMAAVSTAIRQVAKAQKEALTGGADNKAMAAFEKLGITVEQLQTQNAPALFDAIAKQLDGAASNTQTLTNAMTLFGKSGASVLPMMFNGLEQSSERARELGIILQNDLVDNLDETGDRVDELVLRFENGFGQITNVIAGFTNKTTDVFEAFFTGLLVGFDKVKDAMQFGQPTQGVMQNIQETFRLAREGFQQGFEGAVQDQVARDQARAQERQRRREALARAQMEPVDIQPKAEAEAARPLSQSQQSVNQLQRIGAQVGGVPKTETLLKQQVELQKKIERNTARGNGEVIPA